MRVAMGVSSLVLTACAAVSGLDDLRAGSADAEPSPAVEGTSSSSGTTGGVTPRNDAGTGPGPRDGGVADANTDAPPPADGTGPKLEQTGKAFGDATTIRATIAPTKAGSLIVVAIGKETQTVTSLTDNAPGGSNTYVSAGFRPVDQGCGVSGEIWYAKDARPGATVVTAVGSGTFYFQAWILELSGMSKTEPLDVGAVTNDAPRSTSVVAPSVTPTVANAAVVSLAVPCESVSSLQGGSPFTGLPEQQGNAAAYLLATQRGSYGATWTSSSSTWCAATVAFK